MKNDPRLNHLLNALPPEEYARVIKNLEPFAYSQGEELYTTGDPISHGYFPTTGLISRLHSTENGTSFESGMVGNNGFIGIALFMGGGVMPYAAVAQVCGEGFKMKAADVRSEFVLGGEFQRILLRYTQATLTQIAQSAVCNRLHSAEEQLCRWLLTANEQLSSQEIPLTHEMIGNLLGIRREGISIAARQLQGRGYIKYARGKIVMLDRKGLEKNACECYQIVANDYSRLLGEYVPTNR